MKRTSQALAATLLLALQFAGVPGWADDSLKPEMARVFEAMSELLLLSTTAEGFAPESVHPRAGAAFERLGDASMALLDHADTRDADFFALSQGLLDDAERARLAFELGRYDDARLRLNLVTARCIDCHSRLPDLADSTLSDRWIERVKLERLAPSEQARLRVATRRFDEALDTWEGIFRDPASAPSDAGLYGWFRDYLSIAIRVKRDLERPQAVLRAAAARDDTPRFLARRLHRWADALGEIAARPAVEAPADAFRAALEILEAGAAIEPSPFDDEALVHDLAASSLLLTWVDGRAGETADDDAAPDPQLARAWFLLGQIEGRIASDAWFARLETYMEAAVRADPTGDRAARAYEALEESLLTSYGASQAQGLPSRERERLEELRNLGAVSSES